VVQKDYLLRQIEKMGVIMAGLRQKALGGAPAQALAELRAEAARAGVALDFLDVLAPESLVTVLGADSLERLLPAADVLLSKGEIEERLGRTDAAAASFDKASIVLARLVEVIDSTADPDLSTRLEELVHRLADRGPAGGASAP